MGSEVPDPGLARRPTLFGIQIRDGVVDIDRAAYRGGVGEDIGWIAQQDLFAEAGRDLVGIDRYMAGGEVDDRFHTDAAVVAEDHV